MPLKQKCSYGENSQLDNRQQVEGGRGSVFGQILWQGVRVFLEKILKSHPLQDIYCILCFSHCHLMFREQRANDPHFPPFTIALY